VGEGENPNMDASEEEQNRNNPPPNDNIGVEFDVDQSDLNLMEDLPAKPHVHSEMCHRSVPNLYLHFVQFLLTKSLVYCTGNKGREMEVG
jgi:hypothetical protein